MGTVFARNMGDDVTFNEHWGFRGIPESLREGLIFFTVVMAIIVLVAIVMVSCKLWESRGGKVWWREEREQPHRLDGRSDPERTTMDQHFNRLEMHKAGNFPWMFKVFKSRESQTQPDDPTEMCVVVPTVHGSDVYSVPLLEAQYN